MKKLFGIFLLMCCAFTIAIAQKVVAAKVPIAVKTTFAKNHPDTKVNWGLEKQSYEAGFAVKGKKSSEVYSITGSLLETEVSIKSIELPKMVLAELKGMKISEAAKITKANGTIYFEAEVKGKDLLFAANGNPVKQ